MVGRTFRQLVVAKTSWQYGGDKNICNLVFFLLVCNISDSLVIQQVSDWLTIPNNLLVRVTLSDQLSGSDHSFRSCHVHDSVIDNDVLCI